MDFWEVKPGMLVKFNRSLNRLPSDIGPLPGDLAIVVESGWMGGCFNLMHAKSGKIVQFHSFYFTKVKEEK